MRLKIARGWIILKITCLLSTLCIILAMKSYRDIYVYEYKCIYIIYVHNFDKPGLFLFFKLIGHSSIKHVSGISLLIGVIQGSVTGGVCPLGRKTVNDGTSLYVHLYAKHLHRYHLS